MTEIELRGHVAPVAGLARRRTRRRARRREGSAGYFFVAGYAILLVAFGIVPTLYAFYLAFTNDKGQFTGLNQFIKVVQDYRFAPAFLHVAVYLVLWLAILLVLTVAVAIVLRGGMRPGLSAALRFLYYIPGALAGVASVLVWLFMLDPSISPAAGLLRLLGFENFAQVLGPANLPVIFVIIAFWTGAGGWIVVMYGALNNIPDDVLEAARIDGANAWKSAWFVQIPMIGRWIAYMAILAFAGGTQLFVEPQMLQTASLGRLDPAWSPNQLAYVLAFRYGDFNGAAAVSLILLALGLICAGLLVRRSGLFKVDSE
jgi:multiple sugar transport system permease protein